MLCAATENGLNDREMWTALNLGNYFIKFSANYIEVIVIYNKSELDASAQYLLKLNMAGWLWCFQALVSYSRHIQRLLHSAYKMWISVSVFLCLCFFSFPSTIIHHGALACLSVVHLPSSSPSSSSWFSSCLLVRVGHFCKLYSRDYWSDWD
jgi:hypothetical protein